MASGFGLWIGFVYCASMMGLLVACCFVYLIVEAFCLMLYAS